MSKPNRPAECKPKDEGDDSNSVPDRWSDPAGYIRYYKHTIRRYMRAQPGYTGRLCGFVETLLWRVNLDDDSGVAVRFFAGQTALAKRAKCVNRTVMRNTRVICGEEPSSQVPPLFARVLVPKGYAIKRNGKVVWTFPKSGYLYTARPLSFFTSYLDSLNGDGKPAAQRERGTLHVVPPTTAGARPEAAVQVPLPPTPLHAVSSVLPALGPSWDANAAFDAVVEVYPRKERLIAARKIWHSLKLTADQTGEIRAHVIERDRLEWSTFDSVRFVPLLSTFLSEQRWAEQIPDCRGKGSRARKDDRPAGPAYKMYVPIGERIRRAQEQESDPLPCLSDVFGFGTAVASDVIDVPPAVDAAPVPPPAPTVPADDSAVEAARQARIDGLTEQLTALQARQRELRDSRSALALAIAQAETAGDEARAAELNAQYGPVSEQDNALMAERSALVRALREGGVLAPEHRGR